MYCAVYLCASANLALRARGKREKMAAEEGGLFDAAVSAVLRGWPALKMAVSNQFGGPQSQTKAVWMEGATAQWMRDNGEPPVRLFLLCI